MRTGCVATRILLSLAVFLGWLWCVGMDQRRVLVRVGWVQTDVATSRWRSIVDYKPALARLFEIFFCATLSEQLENVSMATVRSKLYSG